MADRHARSSGQVGGDPGPSGARSARVRGWIAGSRGGLSGSAPTRTTAAQIDGGVRLPVPGLGTLTERQPLTVNDIFGRSMRPWESVPSKSGATRQTSGITWTNRPNTDYGPWVAKRLAGQHWIRSGNDNPVAFLEQHPNRRDRRRRSSAGQSCSHDRKQNNFHPMSGSCRDLQWSRLIGNCFSPRTRSPSSGSDSTGRRPAR
jgi:hypothetical protein